MAILAYGVESGSPFCDWLDLTFPKDETDAVNDALRPHLLAVGGHLECPGLWRVPRLQVGEIGGLVQVGSSGCTAKLTTIRDVYRVSLSGGVPTTLRAANLFGAMLADISHLPHRITRMDASIDLPIAGPDSIPRVLAIARSGAFALGRKALAPSDVKFYDNVDARGAVTGTIYLGPPQVRIRGVVYDKRHQLEEVAGYDIGVPRTRVELRLRDVGVTLRDACLPDAVFWNYAAAVVMPPANAPVWSADGVGFDLPPSPPKDYWRILQRRVDDWTPQLLELAALADKMGPYGRRMLYGLLGQALGLNPAQAIAQAA